MRLKSVIMTISLTIGVHAYAQDIPLNPQVSQDNIHNNICMHGWTKTVRPHVSYTNDIKRDMMSKYGIPSEGENAIKLDHIIPLALGGSPSSINNLMLQPDDEAKDKDRVEVCLSRSVCAGLIPLRKAQEAIWNNWRTAGSLCSGYHVIQ